MGVLRGSNRPKGAGPRYAFTLDVPKLLLKQLYLRDAWRLPLATNIPSLVPPVGATQRPAEPTLEVVLERWVDVWGAATRIESGETSLASAPDAADWISRFGPDGVDRSAMRGCVYSTTEKVTRQLLRESASGDVHEYQLPEHAWAVERGLHTVYVLPLAGPYAWWLSPKRLLVSDLTRADLTQYARALSEMP